MLIVKGSMARERIARAVADTEAIIAKVGAKEGAKWVARFRAKVQEFNQRAVREEVGEMIEAGVAKELEPKPNAGASEEAQIKGVAVKVAVTLEHIGELLHRALEGHAANEVNEHLRHVYDKQLRAYLRQTFKEKLFVDAPQPPESLQSKMSSVDAIAWLKGGLDAASAILTLTDPAARKELFEARADYYGSFTQGLEINKILWQFVSGAVAFTGAGTYGLARVLGKADLAAKVLDVSTKWIGNVSGALHLVGVFHGIAVMLDSEATSNEIADAAVEATSSALGIASFASRYTSRLAIAGRWGGPIGISMTLNFWQFSKLAALNTRARIGLARLDWVACHHATRRAATGAQEWMRKLAVVNLLISQETDPARLSELHFVASVYRNELLEGQIKPYLADRMRSETQADPGPALLERFKPLVPIFDKTMKTDDEVLGAAAAFLSVSHTALTEWDLIVASGIR